MKKLFWLAGLVALVSLFTACRMWPSGGELVYRRAGTKLIHPGIMHTQEDFVGMRKLMDRWQGIEGRDYENFTTGDISANTTPVIPQGPPDSDISPQAFYENLTAKYKFVPPLEFGGRPEDNPTPYEDVWEYRESRAARRRMYAEHRAYQNWTNFRDNGEGTTNDWGERRYEYIGRDGDAGGTKNNVEADMRSAYFSAVKWVLTGDKRYAQRTFKILDSYARYLKGFTHAGYYDHMLMVGMQGHIYVAAAEIIRYAHDVVYGESSGFIPEQFQNIDQSIRDIWLKAVLDDYINIPPWRAGNQGAMIIAAYIGIAIYFDDLAMFDHAVDFLVNATSDGNIKSYINPFTGQAGEATRDQPHATLGLSKIMLSAEMAWKQGVNVYGSYDNAMLRASEFICRFNMGDNNVQTHTTMPFDSFNPQYFFDQYWGGNVYGSSLSRADRGSGLEGAEIVYNHYVRRRGMSMPWTEACLQINGSGWAAADSPPGYAAFLHNGAELAKDLGL